MPTSSAPIHVKAKPAPKRRRVPPSSSPVFGPVSRADAPLTRARTQAQHRTQRARRKVEARTTVPYVPQLRHPTSAQRGAAVSIVARGLHRQGIRTAEDVKALPPAQRRRVARATAYATANARYAAIANALAHGAPTALNQRQLERVGRLIGAQTRAEVRPGDRHSRVGLPFGVGTVDLTGVSHALFDRARSGQGVAAADFFAHAAPGFFGRAGSDVVNFPKGAVLGLAEAGHAGYDVAAHGDTRRLKRLGEGLTRGAAGELLVHGDPKAFLKAFSEHPVYSYLDVAGAEAIAGRALGAGARAGGRVAGENSVLARAGSTKRAPLQLYPGSQQAVERRYSPNLINKGVQVLHEKALRARGVDPNVARPSSVPFRGQKHRMNQAVDEFTAQAEGRRRIGREEQKRAGEQIVPTRRGDKAGTRRQRAAALADRKLPDRARAERNILQAVVERRVHVKADSTPAEFKGELLRERDRLQAVYKAERETMSVAARRANRLQVRALTQAAEDPKVLANASGVAEAAQHYVGASKDLERQLIAQNVVAPEQALAAKLRPIAVARYGYRYDKSATPFEESVARHGTLKATEATAKADLAKATEKVRRAQSARDRLVGVQASRRSRRGGRASEAERAALAGASTAVKEARTARRAADAKFKAARRDRVQAHPRNYTTGLVDEHGHRVTTRQILERMHADGIDMPGFVSHRLDTRGTRAYFVNWMSSRKTVDSAKRTGEATRVGAHVADFNALLEHLVHHRGVVDAVHTFDDFVHEFGVKHPDGRMLTADEVDGFMQRQGFVDSHGNQIPGRPKLVALRSVPARYPQATRDAIESGQNALRYPDHSNLVEQRIADAQRPAEGPSAKARNVVLVPETQLKRFIEHQTSSTKPLGKAGQAATGLFRGTVLPFSTKWLFGNVAEATLRLAANGATPFDVTRSLRLGKALTRLDERKARDFQVRTRGGLVYGSADRLKVHRPAAAFEDTVFETPAKAIEAVGHLPVVKQALGGLVAFQRGIFAANRGLETLAQHAAIGKELRRDVQAVSGSWRKAVTAQRAAVEDVARGLLNTPAQVGYARAVDETLGKYSRFSPSTRAFIQSWAPFLPWYLNSLRFVTYTLPAHHPIKTAVLVNIERTYAQDWADSHKDLPPGDLQAGLRTKDGGVVDLARFTPFGAFTHGAQGIVDPLLPQISGAVNILHGKSWTGRDLQLSWKPTNVSEGTKIWLALYSALESAVPGIQIARRLQEHGATAFDNSTVFAPKTKPDTSHGTSAAERVFNPVRPTYLKAPKSATAHSAWGVSSAPAKSSKRGAASSGWGVR